jgi:two-component system, cell cycle sensor histidine kinase and response regulator CckA
MADPAPKPLSLLLVEDSETDAELLVRDLRRHGFVPRSRRVETEADLADALEQGGWDLVISDHNLPSFSSADALRLVKQRAPDLPFILVSGSIGEDYAVEAMRNGASDFVLKDRMHRLAPAVERELREAAQRVEQRRMAAALAESEQRLRQSQRLEAIGRLAGGIAHDFNNLLAAIIGYSKLTLSSLAPDDPLRHDIEEVKLAGERAVDLTRQLLAFSRQQVLHPTLLDLNTVVDTVTRLLRRLIGEHIVLNAQTSSDLWLVKADRSQIEQIVMNLAVNARDAMEKGGTVTIATRNITIEHANQPDVPPRPGRYVSLEVSDTGVGIAPDVLPRIFEPFFTTKEAGRGTGLGLATVYGIVKQSDGYIYVSSAVGMGTVFTIYLPDTTETPTSATVPEPLDQVRS